MFGLTLLIAVAGFGAVLVAKWPFSRAAVIARISRDTGADVTIERLRTTYFPPGFDAENIRLRQRSAGTPILSIQRARVRASYAGLIREKVSEIDVKGFQFAAGHGRSFGSESSGSSFDVSKLVAEDGVIEVFSSDPGHQPFRLHVHTLTLTDIGASHSDFRLAARADRPGCEFSAEGRLGRFRSKSAKATPVSGRYTLSNADLSVYGGMSGLLSSSGRIGGTVGRVEWDGAAVVPEFEVAGTGHKVRLQSDYSVVVDTSDATAELKNIRASFGHSTVLADGRVSQDPTGRGKMLHLALKMEQGRIDDLLWLVSGQPRPGMSGDVRFNASLELPPGPPEFLRRLVLRGNVEITRALFTNPNTQLPLNYLSESAEGMSKQQQRAASQQIPGAIRGAVNDSGGIAQLSDVHYSAPGVHASVGGKFNLIDKRIDLRGVLATEGKLGDGATGLKSVLLTIARPFLGIRQHGKTTTVLFAIRGSSNHPVFSLSPSKAGDDVARVSTR